MQLKSTCKRIDNIPTKIVTQDIPWETLIERKTQSPKASITMYYSTKHHWNTTMEAFNAIATTNQSMWTSMNPHIPCHASDLHKMLPWLTCQALSHLNLSLFAFCFLTCHTNNYPCGCLCSSKSHKTTKWYYIKCVLPNSLTTHLI